MGLLSIIRKIKRKEKEMRILMVGLDNSGKTTIVLKINGEETSIIIPTLGFNIKTISYSKYTLNIMGCWRSKDNQIILEKLLLSKLMDWFGSLIALISEGSKIANLNFTIF